MFEANFQNAKTTPSGNSKALVPRTGQWTLRCNICPDANSCSDSANRSTCEILYIEPDFLKPPAADRGWRFCAGQKIAVEPDSVYTRENRPEFNTEIWFSQTGEKWFKGLSLPGEIYQTPVGSSRPTIVLPSGDYTDTELKITPILGKDADFFLESYRIIWKN